ncbi:18269_t:CDS:2 [Dentiscutata erythropus]|uniref:18269_t:CDS:1 n=1 Tax=Dentiscutata erythropus TaxID=1348616 RepID=A0A9N9BES2_9GLOM|nr:18269_t:CDS:2 [Dentiscutata erythropus]
MCITLDKFHTSTQALFRRKLQSLPPGHESIVVNVPYKLVLKLLLTAKDNG